MKITWIHLGAAFGGAVVPPIVYFLIISFHGQPRIPAAAVLSAEIVTPSPIDSPMPTVTPTPFPTATPTVTPPSTPTPTLTPSPSPTPTLTPTPTPQPVTSEQLDNWFTSYSNQYSIDRQKLWNIAVCESGLNVNAKNGDYGGLYQFSSGTWASTRTAMSADTNPDLRFNPEEAIKTAAFRISTVGVSAWPNCSR